MLTHINIHNFGLIQNLEIDFHAQLNVLTGETGAGKSIIIEALRIALGERIKSTHFRDPSDKCVIEVVFDLAQFDHDARQLFVDYFDDNESILIIHRDFWHDGRKKIKINGQNVTVGQLKELGTYLIDFHGAYEHQFLLSNDSHIVLLDQMSDFGKNFQEYQSLYRDYAGLQKKLADLQTFRANRERELDLLSHQINELEQVPLEESVYEQIQQEQVKLNNASNLVEQVNQLFLTLEGDQNGTAHSINKSFSPMRQLNSIDESTLPWMNDLTQIQEMNDQLLSDLRDYAGSLSFEPNQAQQINDQCDTYVDILRKYGPTLSDAIDFYNQVKEKHELLLNLDQNDEDIRQQLEQVKSSLSSCARKISAARKKSADQLKTTIEKELSELGMPSVQFDVCIEKVDFHSQGQDRVTFFISPNRGEELKPLAEIVSSGEAARVMLGLKKALIHVDPIPVLIFDEIDAQIGGRLGQITGRKLREISLKRQVILITHLPQIASFASAHFKVLKLVKSGRTFTLVEALDQSSKVIELAQMMSGDTKSRISHQHAKDMLAQAKS